LLKKDMEKVGATGDGHFLTTQREQAFSGLPCRKPLLSQQIGSSRSARLNPKRELVGDLP
jgi:hypothetical protein